MLSPFNILNLFSFVIVIFWETFVETLTIIFEIFPFTLVEFLESPDEFF